MGKVPAMKRAWFRNAERIRVDEKIDGSQISFGVEDGKLWIRSRSRFLDLDNPDKMFAAAVESIKSIETRLCSGVTYLGEYLNRPKHNVLAYGRVPEKNIVLFDAVNPGGHFHSIYGLRDLAETLGLECVQGEEMSFNGTMPGADYFKTSMLGGIPEGVVVKAGEHLEDRIIAKIVSEQFKEVKGDRTSRQQANPQQDIAIKFANRFCPPARFHKAVQKLKEAGECNEAMSDIPRLRQLLMEDIETECGAEIREELYEMFRKKIMSASLQPLAPWYEQYLTNDNAYWSAYRDE